MELSEKTVSEVAKKIQDFFEDLNEREEFKEVDLCYHLNFKEITIDLLNERLSISESVNHEYIYNKLMDNNALDVGIVFYASAMDYLKKEDSSLSYVLELAGDLGFQTKDLDSEKLASILASENVRESFINEKEVINDFFEELIEEYMTALEKE